MELVKGSNLDKFYTDAMNYRRYGLRFEVTLAISEIPSFHLPPLLSYPYLSLPL